MTEACTLTYIPLMQKLLESITEEQIVAEIEAEEVSEEMAEWVEKKKNGE